MDSKEKESVYGKRMIEIKVRFFTNGIASQKGKIVPKHCWDSGVVRISSNEVFDIKQSKIFHFRSLMDIPRAIENCLIAQNITIHAGRYLRKYIAKK